jgi:hypothetical protein
MEIHYHPEFFFIFYSKILEFFFHKKKVKLEKKLHYPKKNISKNIKKFKKFKKNAMGFVQKRNKKKGGKFCPQKKLDSIL